MKNITRIAAATIATTAAFAAPAAANAATWFRTPTGNIICKVSTTSAKCDVESDYLGASVTRWGGAHFTGLHSDVDYGDFTLGYGRKWTNGHFTCYSNVDGLSCESRGSGRGFFIARNDYWRF